MQFFCENLLWKGEFRIMRMNLFSINEKYLTSEPFACIILLGHLYEGQKFERTLQAPYSIWIGSFSIFVAFFIFNNENRVVCALLLSTKYNHRKGFLLL